MVSPRSFGRRSPERLAAVIVLTAVLIWLFSLPVWPSLDSPVHLYYARVFGSLLAHPNGVFSRDFAIKHLAPPYALYYYMLMGLTRFTSAFVADRLVIALYMVLFLAGFHALAHAITPEDNGGADRSTLLASLLLLNWPLGMGFVNYCLSLAFALWALAFWFRLRRRPSLSRRVGFVLLCLVTTLAHPVPLLLVLGLSVADWLREALRTRRFRREDLLTLLGSSMSLLYVFAFTEKHPLRQRTVAEMDRFHTVLRHYSGFLTGQNVSLVFGNVPTVLVYRLALTLILFGALFAGVVQLRRDLQRGKAFATHIFLGLALLLFLILPWMPSDISGAYFFPERLVLVVWICALLGMAGWTPESTHLQQTRSRSVIVVALAVTVCLLTAADTALRPFAQRAKEWRNGAFVSEGDRVLITESENLPSARRITPSWNPTYWMAVHAVRVNDAILVNAPWLDSAILPLVHTGSRLPEAVSPQIINSPNTLGSLLRSEPLLSKEVLAGINVVSFSNADLEPGSFKDPLLRATGRSWMCEKTKDGGDKICRSRP